MTNRSDPPTTLRALRTVDADLCAICGADLADGGGVPPSGPRLAIEATGTLELSAPTVHDPYFWAFCRDCYPRVSLALGATIGSLIREHQAKKKRAQ